MAEEDAAQKTEPATPKRIEDARKKGQVAQSRDLQSFVVLSAAGLALLGGGPAIARGLDGTMRESFAAAAAPPSSMADYHALLLATGGPVLAAVAIWAIGIVAFAALVQTVQVGPMFSAQALQFRGDRIDPIKGFQRFFKLERWVELLKSLVKVTAISGAAVWAFRPGLSKTIGLSGVSIGESVLVLGDLLFDTLLAALAVVAAIAVFDLVFQRRRHATQLKMTKREVRDELKQTEGDPDVRARYRSRQRELSRSRMIAAVTTADVVVTNPTRFAVALKYDRATMAAPAVVAKGRERVAARIREAARAAGVPVVEDPPLARLLHKTGVVGREIPENLFQAVAELLALIYRLRDERRAAS